MKIVLASSNKHKVQEINDIISSLNLSIPVEIVLPPEGFDPIEDGNTFEENSLIKAKAAWELSKTWSLADDSGLCIDSLNGNPGIYSARYADTPRKRIERVLNELKNKDNRDAHFSCAMTLINPKGNVEFKCLGVCRGTIINEAKGSNGFGYDPIFLPSGYTQTMAELSEEEKSTISHRSIALNQMLTYISNNLK